MTNRLIAVTWSIGLAASTAAAAISYAIVIGQAPAFVLMSAGAWVSTIRIGHVPLEFFCAVLFLYAGILSANRNRHHLASLVPATFVSAAAIAGLGLWHFWFRNGWAALSLAAAVSAAIIVILLIASSHLWPTRIRSTAAADLGRLRSQPWVGAVLAISIAAPTSVALMLHGYAQRVPQEHAYDENLKRWYLAQSAADQEFLRPLTPNAIRVVVFADYLGSDPGLLDALAVAGDPSTEPNIQVEFIDFPSDTQCNAGLVAKPLDGSCEVALVVRAVRAARGVNGVTDLVGWLSARLSFVTPQAILDHATTLGVVATPESLSREYRAALIQDVATATRLGVTRATTSFVNGIQIPTGRGLLRRILRYEGLRLANGVPSLASRR